MTSTMVVFVLPLSTFRSARAMVNFFRISALVGLSVSIFVVTRSLIRYALFST